MDPPVNENYLSQFRDCFPLHVADFLRVWYHYDKDRSGYLEIAEFKSFLQDLITNAGSKITTKEVEEYAKNLIDMYDADCDARIGLNELSKIITVEENFLKRFKKLNLEDFDAIFKHYDQDGTGSLEDAELLGFIKDLMEKIDGIKDPSIDEVEAYKITVLRSIGGNDSGKISKEDLKLLFI